MELDPLSAVEGVQRARDPESAWQCFRRQLAQDGFERVMCFFGVDLSEPFPDQPKGCVPFYRDTVPADVIDFFARHPEYKRNNPVVRHARTSPRPVLPVGDDPSVPLGPKARRMLAELLELYGDVDINSFPLPNPAARQYGLLGVLTRRTREARRHLRHRRDALHLAGHYFCGAMQARFPLEPTRLHVLHVSLSPRQQECLAWVAAGLTSDEISARLNLSSKTVDLHLAAAMRKLDAGSRAQAAARAVALGLVHP